MDEMQKELKEQRELLDRIFVSVEKTRKIFTWTMIISVAVIVLPLIGLMFVIPSFVSNYTSTINELTK